MDDLTRLPSDVLARDSRSRDSRDPSSGSDWGRFAPGTIFAGRFRIVAPLGICLVFAVLLRFGLLALLMTFYTFLLTEVFPD